jgi:hypothetical protein
MKHIQLFNGFRKQGLLVFLIFCIVFPSCTNCTKEILRAKEVSQIEVSIVATEIESDMKREASEESTALVETPAKVPVQEESLLWSFFKWTIGVVGQFCKELNEKLNNEHQRKLKEFYDTDLIINRAIYLNETQDSPSRRPILSMEKCDD